MKWPPEMWPTAETMTAITSPCAKATPTSPPAVAANVSTAPAPTKVRAKAPTNSAVLRANQSRSTGADRRNAVATSRKAALLGAASSCA